MDGTLTGDESSLAVPIEAHGERVVEWRPVRLQRLP